MKCIQTAISSVANFSGFLNNMTSALRHHPFQAESPNLMGNSDSLPSAS